MGRIAIDTSPTSLPLIVSTKDHSWNRSMLYRVQSLSFDLQRPSKPSHWVFAGFVWAAIAVTLATQSHLRETALRINNPWLDSFRFPLIECAFWFLVTPFLFWLVHRFDLFNGWWPRRLLFFVAANAAVVIVHALYRLPSHHFVYPRMEPIPAQLLLRLYVLGNMLNDVWVYWSIVALAHLAVHYVRSAQREQALAQAQMQALKSQLQPHFFFNALHSISSLMRDDVEAADEMITRLSDLLRVSLKTDTAQEIPLLKEIQVVETYVEIEKMRFSDRLQFTCDLDEDTLQAKVPALILLPLIENAVRHGIGQRSEPGAIMVSARQWNGALKLTLSNDTRPGSGRIIEGIGLAGTRIRLMQHYGRAAVFAYTFAPEGVMTVEIKLPFVLENSSYANPRSHRR